MHNFGNIFRKFRKSFRKFRKKFLENSETFLGNLRKGLRNLKNALDNFGDTFRKFRNNTLQLLERMGGEKGSEEKKVGERNSKIECPSELAIIPIKNLFRYTSCRV